MSIRNTIISTGLAVLNMLHPTLSKISNQPVLDTIRDTVAAGQTLATEVPLSEMTSVVTGGDTLGFPDQTLQQVAENTAAAGQTLATGVTLAEIASVATGGDTLDFPDQTLQQVADNTATAGQTLTTEVTPAEIAQAAFQFYRSL